MALSLNDPKMTEKNSGQKDFYIVTFFVFLVTFLFCERSDWFANIIFVGFTVYSGVRAFIDPWPEERACWRVAALIIYIFLLTVLGWVTDCLFQIIESLIHALTKLAELLFT